MSTEWARPRVVQAKCPFCHQPKVVGAFPDEHPGERVPMLQKCEQFVFVGFTKYLGVEYAHEELRVELDYSLGTDAELLRLLSGRFVFVGPIVFAVSKERREEERAAVEDFLRARKTP